MTDFLLVMGIFIVGLIEWECISISRRLERIHQTLEEIHQGKT